MKEQELYPLPANDIAILGDDKMCLKHSDCPSFLPLCVPGQYATDILSKPIDVKVDFGSMIGVSYCSVMFGRYDGRYIGKIATDLS